MIELGGEGEGQRNGIAPRTVDSGYRGAEVLARLGRLSRAAASFGQRESAAAPSFLVPENLQPRRRERGSHPKNKAGG